MTSDDVIRMAREAGFETNEDGIYPLNSDALVAAPADLLRFAAMVATRVAAAEREACAKACEEIFNWDAYMAGLLHTDSLKACVSAIRARGHVSDKAEERAAKGGV